MRSRGLDQYHLEIIMRDRCIHTRHGSRIKRIEFRLVRPSGKPCRKVIVTVHILSNNRVMLLFNAWEL